MSGTQMETLKSLFVSGPPTEIPVCVICGKTDGWRTWVIDWPDGLCMDCTSWAQRRIRELLTL